MVGEVKVSVIENNVSLCSGCKVTGDISIGENVVIGANSVVTKTVEKICCCRSTCKNNKGN